MDGWMDGWMDGCLMNSLINGQIVVLSIASMDTIFSLFFQNDTLDEMTKDEKVIILLIIILIILLLISGSYGRT